MRRVGCVVLIVLMVMLAGCTFHVNINLPGTSQPVQTTSPAESTAGDTQPSAVTTAPSVPEETVRQTEPFTEPTAAPATQPWENTALVEYPVENNGNTHTGLPALDAAVYLVKDPGNDRNLSTQRYDFSFGAAKNGKPHQITVDNQSRFDALQTSTLAWDNITGEKVLYLTFDCGYKYENLTQRILDTLKEKNVKAAFFCTMSYLQSAPDEVSRMILEGHIVGNHSVSHPSDCAALSREALAREVLGVHNYLLGSFGYECKYFRFPAGVYSENALELMDSVGYRSAFWSIAYADWDPENQQGEDIAFQTVTERLHPGAVILLHSTSPDNAAILADFIDYAHAQGYEFRTLDEYPGW